MTDSRSDLLGLTALALVVAFIAAASPFFVITEESRHGFHEVEAS